MTSGVSSTQARRPGPSGLSVDIRTRRDEMPHRDRMREKRLTLDMSRSKGVEYAGGYCPNVVGWTSSIAMTDSIHEKFKGVERNATGGRR